AERRIAGRRRGKARGSRNAGLAPRVVFIRSEIEELIFDDRAADHGAQAIAVETWGRRQRSADKLALERLVDRVEVLVLQIFPDCVVQCVRSADQHGVELTAGRVAIFRAELILDDRELRNGVVGNAGNRTSHILAVIVDAFNVEAVIARALAADRRAESDADT